jgi:uncharacterized protein DUF4440
MMKTIRWDPAVVAFCVAVAGCASVTLDPGADQINVTRNAADVAACTSLGKVNITQPMLTDPDAQRQLLNQTLSLGGDALLLTSLGRSGSAYRCGEPRASSAQPPASAPAMAAPAPAEMPRAQADVQKPRTEEVIAGLEDQWLQSQKMNNPDLVAPLLADRFVSTGSDGKVTDKTQALADAKARKYTSVEYEDVQITVFGDTAIATGGFRGKGTEASGKPFDEHERWTDTWVKMPNGRWQCVATQTSPIN